MKVLLSSLILLLAAGAGALYLSPATLFGGVQLIGRELAGLSSRQVQVEDLQISYYEGGPADGATILMVHGFGANRDNWLSFARHFTKHYHVIALDLPGFGESSKPDTSYDVGSQADRLQAFLNTLNINKIHLIGNSMGGHIAALYAARHPEQVLSLALLDNAGVTSPRTSEMHQRIERGEPNPLVVRKAEDFETLLNFVFVTPPLMPDSLKRYLGEQAMIHQAHYDKIFAQLRARNIPLESELPKITAPTLLLWGEQDRIRDVSSISVMKPLLQKPSVVIIKECGHAPMIERPNETAKHYQDFLDASQD